MNVQPGDLAIIVHSLRGDSVGMVCEIVSWRLPNAEMPSGGWTIRFKRPVQTTTGRSNTAAAPDAWLRRISGPPVGEDIATDNPVRHEVTA